MSIWAFIRGPGSRAQQPPGAMGAAAVARSAPGEGDASNPAPPEDSGGSQRVDEERARRERDKARIAAIQASTKDTGWLRTERAVLNSLAWRINTGHSPYEAARALFHCPPGGEPQP